MISARKYVDPAGNVSYHLTSGKDKHILRFTADQYRDSRDRIAVVVRRTKNQLKGSDRMKQLRKKEYQ